MCGFVCIVDFENKIDEKLFVPLNNSSNHRGPDNTGFIYQKNFLFYFRRLAIIDLDQRSNQPFSNEDKTIYLVLNGEIYNFIELRDQLKVYGHSFKTSGDTEVLLKAYEQWGEECVSKLRGMFSFCIWDNNKRSFFAFRDRFGIKPLYYCRHKSTYIFSSEIKDIKLLVNSFQENINTVYKYLSLGFIDDTSETFYSGISSLNSSHYLKLNKLGKEIHKYWEIDLSSSRPFRKDEFSNLFDDTIKIHLRSDVPVAFALSGGLDSNAITSFSALHLKNETKLKAYSISPPETIDESYWINKAVNHYALEHSYINCDNVNVSEYFNKVLFFHDEPFHSSSIFYHFIMREKIKNEGFKVLMVGEGADEVLSGYRRLLYPYIFDLEKKGLDQILKATIAKSAEFMQIKDNDILKNYLKFKEKLLSKNSDIENNFHHRYLKKEIITERQDMINSRYNLDEYTDNYSVLKQSLSDHVFKRDLPYVLRMEDRNSMGNSIESRVPFLDHKLIDHIFSISPEYFMLEGKNKYMLRECIKKMVPKEILDRKTKSARPGSDLHFLSKLVKKEMLDLLNNNKNLIEFFNIDLLAKDFNENLSYNNANFYFRVYSYLKWKNINF